MLRGCCTAGNDPAKEEGGKLTTRDDAASLADRLERDVERLATDVVPVDAKRVRLEDLASVGRLVVERNVDSEGLFEERDLVVRTSGTDCLQAEALAKPDDDSAGMLG